MGSLTTTSPSPFLTSSKTGTFYLAFGSNLSPTQMRGRLTSSPNSSIPIAIARLHNWKWIICQRGYANIVELPKSSSSSSLSNSTTRDGNPISNPNESTVWGVLYNLSPEDEETLDAYEGHNDGRNQFPKENPTVEDRVRKPFLQGGWDYNKLYLPVTVTKWLVEPAEFGLEEAEETTVGLEVRVLVYVDEERVDEGTINEEYIGRMNRAIDEGVGLGLPGEWCEAVMRKWIPKGVYPGDYYYFGTSEGYVEEESIGTEAS